MRTWQLIGVSLGALLMAGSAQAVGTMVAGWDFSQYNGDGSLDTGSDFVGEGTLDANYSNQTAIPDGAGPAANPYGTMYVDGTYGSGPVDYEFGFPPDFSATSGNLGFNADAPQLYGGPTASQFGSCGAVAPQDNCLDLSMQALASDMKVVFEATLAPDSLIGENWAISFAAKTDSSNANIGVEFSVDGTTWTDFGNQAVSSAGGVVSVDFSSFDLGGGEDQSDTAYARLTFNGTSLDRTLIDNFAFNAGNVFPIPEPGTFALLGLGLVGLASVRGPRRDG